MVLIGEAPGLNQMVCIFNLKLYKMINNTNVYGCGCGKPKPIAKPKK